MAGGRADQTVLGAVTQNLPGPHEQAVNTTE